MVCDKDEWDNTDIMLMPKKAMCMNSHRKPISYWCSQPRKQARNCRKLPCNSGDKCSCQPCGGVHYSADYRGTRQESDGE